MQQQKGVLNLITCLLAFLLVKGSSGDPNATVSVSTTATPVSTTSTKSPKQLRQYHPAKIWERYRMRHIDKNNKNEFLNKEAASKVLRDFYHNEELRDLRMRLVHPRLNQSDSEVQSKGQNKQSNETNQVFAVWFSCTNINTCIALTAGITSVLSMLVVFCVVALCFHCRSPKKTFSADEWWKQSAATPLLLIPSLKDDEDQQQQQQQQPKNEDLVRLRKYLKKYMAINQAKQQRAASMPDIPEETDNDAAGSKQGESLTGAQSFTSYQGSAKEPTGSMRSQLSVMTQNGPASYDSRMKEPKNTSSQLSGNAHGSLSVASQLSGNANGSLSHKPSTASQLSGNANGSLSHKPSVASIGTLQKSTASADRIHNNSSILSHKSTTETVQPSAE